MADQEDFSRTGAVTDERIHREFEESLTETLSSEPVSGYRDAVINAFKTLWDNEEQRPQAIHLTATNLLVDLGKLLADVDEDEQ